MEKQRNGSAPNNPLLFFPALFPALSPALLGIWAFTVLWQVASIPILEKQTSDQPNVFLTAMFSNSPGVMNVRAFESRMSVPKCFFSRAWPKLSTLDVRPHMSCAICPERPPLAVLALGVSWSFFEPILRIVPNDLSVDKLL